MAYKYIPEPYCILRDVRKLPAAHLMVVTAEQTRIERYWQVDFSSPTRISESDFELGNFLATDNVFALTEGESLDGDGRIGLRWHVVPEPSRVLLLIVGLMASAARRTRRR